MITLIVGKKGTGKTKKLIERANEAVNTSNGNVVVIEKGSKLTYDLSHKARLVNIEDYGIKSVDALHGFISGLCAANYDITDIFVDSTLKIVGQDLSLLPGLFEKLSEVAVLADTKITLLVSADESELPAGINSVVEKI